MGKPENLGWYGVSLDPPPRPEEVALQREATEQFFKYVAKLQVEQAIEIHPVQV